ncbi:MAG: hypothetical protein ACOYMN_04430 [Roseimicrobium sp.]
MQPRRTSRHSTPPDLRALAALLRRTAEVLESNLPLLDGAKLAPQAQRLHDGATELLATEPTALVVPREDYQALRHDWLEAWSLHPKEMNQEVAATFEAKTTARSPEEDDTLHRLRLLVHGLKEHGTEKMRSLLDRVMTAEPLRPTADFGMRIDREANATVQRWGRLTSEVFLSQWKQLDAEMIARACTVLGLAVAKRWTRTQQAELHRRAQRFARNTSV